jgi:sigma-B regulation protein RsbU (phosphoserine phosphatase)
LESTGIPLGIYPDDTTPMGCGITLEEGDVVLMLTDGAIEIQSPDGQFFGVGRAIECVRHCLDRSAQEILDCLYETVLEFSGRGNPDDDVTAVVLKVGAKGTVDTVS